MCLATDFAYIHRAYIQRVKVYYHHQLGLSSARRKYTAAPITLSDGPQLETTAFSRLNLKRCESFMAS